MSSSKTSALTAMETQQSQMDIGASPTEKETIIISDSEDEEMPTIKMPSIKMKMWRHPKSLRETAPSNNERSTMVGSTEIQPFPFMRLPLEVRTMIFKHFLVMPFTVRVAKYFSIPSGSKSVDYITQGSICSTFSVSKAFYREAADIYYRFNTFYFPRLDDLFFFRHLAPDHRRAVRKIDIDYTGQSPAKVSSFLQTFVGLRRLHITFFPGQFRVPYYDEEFLEPQNIVGFQALSKIRGLEHLEITVWWPNKEYVEDHRVQIRESLSCLLEPHDATRIARLDKKDYPDKFHRSVFGNANVATRMEHKVMGTKPLTP